MQRVNRELMMQGQEMALQHRNFRERSYAVAANGTAWYGTAMGN